MVNEVWLKSFHVQDKRYLSLNPSADFPSIPPTFSFPVFSEYIQNAQAECLIWTPNVRCAVDLKELPSLQSDMVI